MVTSSGYFHLQSHQRINKDKEQAGKDQDFPIPHSRNIFKCAEILKKGLYCDDMAE